MPGSRSLVNGKGGPIESRPIVKSEFRQIPPNRLQLVNRIEFTWSICLSTIAQSDDEDAEIAKKCVMEGLFLRRHGL
jgi:hypothetical protein